jgi:uncharacterized protein YdcH (DUF465 family)
MSFEELIKKYESLMAVPMYPKALVIDFMKKAYVAGIHADVHTDNSAVIAELENKIADIKANCDLALEGRDVKIMELEKENEQLTVSYETLKLHDEEEIGMLKSENAELKRIIDNDVDKKIYVQLAEKAKLADVQKEQLTKAKFLLKQLVDAFPKSYSDVVKDTLDEARKFVQSVFGQSRTIY